MARFYESLKDEIKNAMAILDFPTSWTNLIGLASRLDDNQRRRAAEKKGWHHNPNTTPHKGQERHPDEMDWQASSVTKQYRKERKTDGGGATSLKKKGKCFNYGREGHFARECRSPKKANGAQADQPEPKKEKRAQAVYAEVPHEQLMWTACYDDGCLIHLSSKDGAGWFPQREGKAGGGKASPEPEVGFRIAHRGDIDPTEMSETTKSLVVQAFILERPAKMLIDSGCEGNFIWVWMTLTCDYVANSRTIA
jgi:hypothetical protein